MSLNASAGSIDPESAALDMSVLDDAFAFGSAADYATYLNIMKPKAIANQINANRRDPKGRVDAAGGNLARTAGPGPNEGQGYKT